MKIRKADTLEELNRLRYRAVDTSGGIYEHGDHITIFLKKCCGIVITPWEKTYFDFGNEIFYHSGTEETFAILKNKFETIFALERLERGQL